MDVKRSGIFKGDNPFEIARTWLAEATATEVNDPNAIALSTVDTEGMPNARMVLLKAIEEDAFVFFTNYESAKAGEIETAGKAAFVMHWKSLQRQIRVRGNIMRESDEASDLYYKSRALGSRIGAWASAQSRPLVSKASLMEAVAKQGLKHGPNPKRPPFWGGYRVVPTEIEFWAAGDFRLHDRFRWTRATEADSWSVSMLNP
ncbi:MULTISPECIES: pyridoxamine 5'-phosphate oxidase [Pacificibacter]|uniref:pyridoxamine 5'-phosphate oxidase n=1 Tax=Pacificibacter TaxID=1042323 RepID=UPI001C089D1D|nr:MULTISPECIES: pyridoxamine 5'-phosphate oxidase [Pacificibacter]MBU2936206.1 pyridoxamine 5'-phosphate oxidase [Pacificibacter marinus]MDO6616801.1 pyridoxamine 5'-phosphate oxidase [Pacificibacter sp. 1_MG-2023]